MANRTKNKKNRTKKVNVFNQSFTKNQVNEFDDPVKNETSNISSSKINKVTKNISTKEEINQKYLPYELRKIGILTSLVAISLIIISFII
ncbi:MAG: hypothetical protein CL903_01550 [Dehalococcoidia bacterium]|nr:hypothetical protein [Dehalococcoidia bacterium]MQG09510.1 hypothetical protein [SAR202 cluster bacterium]|tara:strand:- start:10826 stop:11095 length:270 start_codon:yes stop_codon:yes gene_type:complete